MLFLKDISSLLGKEIGCGSERRCYIKVSDPSRCLKISKKQDSDQTLREIKYFEFLQNISVVASFVPKFYGAFETDDHIGYEQECFLPKENGGIYDEVFAFDRYILSHPTEVEKIKLEMMMLKSEMVNKNIICSDLSASNVLKVRIDEEINKIVVIDGYGPTELLPLCQYVKFLGKMKMERQWDKFEKRIRKHFSEAEVIVAKNQFNN